MPCVSKPSLTHPKYSGLCFRVGPPNNIYSLSPQKQETLTARIKTNETVLAIKISCLLTHLLGRKKNSKGISSNIQKTEIENQHLANTTVMDVKISG